MCSPLGTVTCLFALGSCPLAVFYWLPRLWHQRGVFLLRIFNCSASHLQFKACLEIFYEGAIAWGRCDFNMSGFVATLIFFCTRLVHLQPYENNSCCKTHINMVFWEPVNALFAAYISLDYAIHFFFFLWIL